MNKKDIQALKVNHRIEIVMRESGETLEADDKHPEILRSRITPGLVVNTKTQTFELIGSDKKTKNGDVLTWLQHSYSWSFPMALKYLQSRTPDPKQEAELIRGKVNPIVFDQNDYLTATHVYSDPITGRLDIAWNVNYDIMDDYQKKAFDIAHDWIVKHFGKSSRELWDEMEQYPHRFKSLVDFSIDKCACCEKPFHWHQIGTVAYAQERSEFVTIYGSSEDGSIDFTGQLVEADELYIDQDFVICEKCLREVYAPRYTALRLCWRSARRREKGQEKRADFFYNAP